MWSAPVTITQPVFDPLPLGDAKSFLRYDDDASADLEVAVYAEGARAAIESTTSTRLAPQTVRLFADSFADLAHLPIGPVTAIVALNYRDAGGEDQAIPLSSVELFGAGLERGIRLRQGSWPQAAPVAGAIAVEIDVGYDELTLPGQVKLALWHALSAAAEGRTPAVESLLVNHRIWA